MGSVSGTGMASRDRFSENNWGTTTQNRNEQTSANQAGNRRAVFDSPESQQLLAYLTGQSMAGGQYQGQAGDAYSTLAGMSGQVNPYVDQMIAANDANAENMFRNRLAQSRAQGYRGGTGANLYGQDKVAADFTAQQAANNAAVRYGAFNDASNRELTANVAGAGGLASLSDQGQGIAAQLLALLRGEDVQNQSDINTTANATINEIGGRSGKKSNTGQSISASYQYM